MFKKNDLVKVKAEWLDPGESPDLIYLVIDDESERGAVND